MDEIKPGDIFLVDSNRWYAKVVKFLNLTPTLWHYLWYKLLEALSDTSMIDEVRAYHAGIVLNEFSVIEQQEKVQVKDLSKILKANPIIWQKITLTDDQRSHICAEAMLDIGKGYDGLLILGKTLTWLTGIKWFARKIQAKNKEICVTLVGKWYLKGCGERFNVKSYHLITTESIDSFCLSSNEWKEINVEGE